MDQATVQTISALLDEMAARFGATGAHLWEELVRYQVVTAQGMLVLNGFLVVVGVAFGIASLYAWQRDEHFSDTAIAMCGVSVFTLLMSVIMFSDAGIAALATLAAPEAATLKALIP